MIRAEFFKLKGEFYGFCVTGHAGAGEYGQDIVCSAVSSAVMLTANTITDFLLDDADVRVGENEVVFMLKAPCSDKADAARRVIASFKKHLEIIAENEKGAVHVTEKEV